MKVAKKTLKILAIILMAIILIFLLVVAGFNIYQRITYKDFYKASNKEYIIPGLSEGFTPQGLTYDETSKIYLSCGYMKNGGASRIYIRDEKGGVSFVELLDEKGNPNECHAGGLAVYKDFLYLTNDGMISVYDMKLIRQGNPRTSPIYTFDPLTGPAFCYVENDLLYVGEFYIAEDYETPLSHRMTTDSGDEHKSIMTVFQLDATTKSGLKSEVPVVIYSITDFAQGMCITDKGQICISTSYGLSNSHIYIYDDPMKGNEDKKYTVTVEGKDVEVPLYYLDSAHLKKTVTAPPMTEELLYKDGRVLIMTESASNKYIFGKLSGGNYVYSFEA